MAEFICRLGTPAGEVVTRTIEAVGVAEARVRRESEGFRVFSVTPPRARGIAALTRGGKGGMTPRIKAGDFLLFNQQLSALLRAGIPILHPSPCRRRASRRACAGCSARRKKRLRRHGALFGIRRTGVGLPKNLYGLHSRGERRARSTR